MKKMKKTGMMPASPPAMGMGNMVGRGQPMMRPPMTRPPVPAAPPTRRPPLMKARGMPLAGFMPMGGKKAKRGKKRTRIPV
jgi:hypothetical protein